MKNNLALAGATSKKYGIADLLEIIFQERLKYSGLVSSAIDHGIHTPLIIIKGLAEMSLRNPDQDPRPNLKKISKEAEHILKLLAAMTFVAPPEPVHIQNVSLKDQVERVIIYFEKKCLDIGVSIKVDISDNLRIETDPNRLRSILISLIQNSVDSFDKVSASAPRSLFIHTQNKDGQIDLIISDTGSGMTPQIQENVVNKILNSKADDGLLHAGLGLPLAKKMSDDLGLQLSYVTEKEKGTTFTVRFPN